MNCGITDKFFELQSIAMKEMFAYFVHSQEQILGQVEFMSSLPPTPNVLYLAISVSIEDIDNCRLQSHLKGLPVKR